MYIYIFPRVIGHRRRLFHAKDARRKRKERYGKRSSLFCSVFKCLWPVSRDVFYRASTEEGEGGGEEYYKAEIRPSDLGGLRLEMARRSSAFYFWRYFARPFRSAYSSFASKAPDIFHSFETVLPSLSQLSNIILPSINFASVSVSGRYRVDIVVTREN